MRIDWSRHHTLSDEEQKFLRLMRGARALAAVFVIGGIAVIGATTGSFESELARADAPAESGAAGGLMALEAGVPG